MGDKTAYQKMFIKEGMRLSVIGAPDNYSALMGNLPDGVELESELQGSFDAIHVFAVGKAEIEGQLPDLKAALKPGGALWVSYPKGGALGTDLNRDILNGLADGHGLKGVRLIALDSTWSAMCFKHAE